MNQNEPHKQIISSKDDLHIDYVLKGLGAKNIALVGFMGVGKTTCGKILAHALGRRFYDLDQEIERRSRLSIVELYELYGEKEFRLLEYRVLTRLCKKQNLVISTGGSSFCHDETRNLLLKETVTIWLQNDFAPLEIRLQRRKTRPLLLNKNIQSEIRKLYNLRRPFYNLCNLKVMCGALAPKLVVTKILQALYLYLQQKAQKES